MSVRFLLIAALVSLLAAWVSAPVYEPEAPRPNPGPVNCCLYGPGHQLCPANWPPCWGAQ